MHSELCFNCFHLQLFGLQQALQEAWRRLA
jgi:hypothetical protein